MIPGAPENKRLIADYQNKDALHHYKIISKLGFPDGVRCWCGATVEFGVNESRYSCDKRRKEFFDKHDDCQPMEVK